MFASMGSFKLTKGICKGMPSFTRHLVTGSTKFSRGILLGSLDFHNKKFSSLSYLQDNWFLSVLLPGLVLLLFFLY